MAGWKVVRTGTLPPFPTPREGGLRSYQAQAAGGPELLWLMGKELLAPWLHFPGLLVHVSPVQTGGLTGPSFLGF